jgi:phosphopantothenoylcysteine decarboxylase/phosphopantothenate--cysteine ligase
MSASLKGRRILLVLSGGIAAYKGLDLIRRIKDLGATVRCVLTKGAEQFVTPLSVATLSGEPAFDDLWSLTDEQKIGHIRLARENDLVVVAPATANLIAKMAHGLADDLASTVLLATRSPILIAPAMNVAMWENPATEANIATLKSRDFSFVGPEKGPMACDEVGEGRMSEPADILAAIVERLAKKGPLSGKKAIVTSGPTYEALDPVRFIGNRSSGKQGHAIASALAEAGASVVLVTGPVSLPDPKGVDTVHVETAREMLTSCEENLPADIVVCAAAVADWRPASVEEHKIKKDGSSPSISFAENPDILATLSHLDDKPPHLVIGFAAETQHVLENAEAKLKRKGCDWLLANEVGCGKVFGEDSNQVVLLKLLSSGKVSQEPWPILSKAEVAQKLVSEIVNSYKKDAS